MTTLGSPGLSSQSVLGFSGRKEPQKTRNGLGLQAWEAKVCHHPSPFRGLLAEKGNKNTKTDWDDNPGKPRLVIPVRFGVFWPKKAKNTETDCNPGKPRLVIPVRFGVFWPKRAKKTRNGLG